MIITFYFLLFSQQILCEKRGKARPGGSGADVEVRAHGAEAGGQVRTHFIRHDLTQALRTISRETDELCVCVYS